MGNILMIFYAITINEAAAIVALDDYGNIILKKNIDIVLAET